MFNDIQKFVDTCIICIQNKSQHQAPSGLLQPLPIPPQPWHTVSLDFIVELQPTTKGFATILTVVDHFTRMAHFIPLKKLPSAIEMAHIFFKEIIRLHGIPSIITSDRGPQLISHFWQHLSKSLNMEVRTSSSYHPQTDGLTERTNQTIEQYLRCMLVNCVQEWSDILWALGFAYSNMEHSSIDMSPFFALMVTIQRISLVKLCLRNWFHLYMSMSQI